MIQNMVTALDEPDLSDEHMAFACSEFACAAAAFDDCVTCLRLVMSHVC